MPTGIDSRPVAIVTKKFPGTFRSYTDRRCAHMKICFPALKNLGVSSTIYGHFASAPLFLEVDTDTDSVSEIPNCDKSDPDAGCNPFKALAGRQFDGVVVGGVGDGSLQMLNFLGFRVFQAQSESLQDNLELFARKALTEVVMQDSAEEGRCAGADDDHQCSHTHDDHQSCCH